MTLNTARKIETAFDVVTIIILLPFALVIQILEWLIKLLTLPIDGRNWLSQKLGNKLMNMSDAVKDGTIKNPYCLKNYTARMAWKHLKEAEKSKRGEEGLFCIVVVIAYSRDGCHSLSGCTPRWCYKLDSYIYF